MTTNNETVFSRIVGHNRAVMALKRALLNNRPAHAVIISGPQGVGKFTLASAFTAALNCAVADNDGCGTCSSCTRIEANNHPDVVVVRRDGNFIKIDQVRQLQHHLATRPHEAKWRVIVIDEAEHLHKSAANALLKAVEEPQRDTIFILTTSAPHLVAPTLISRCQRLRLAPLGTDDLITVVQRHTTADEHTLRRAAELFDGSAGRALALIDSELFQHAETVAASLYEAARTDSATTLFDVVSEAGREREHLALALDLMQLRLRSALLVSLGLNRSTPAATEKDPAVDLYATPHDLLQALRTIQVAQEALRQNANVTLTLEAMVLDLREDARQ